MAGQIVKVKLGYGLTKNGDTLVDGKIKVYLKSGNKVLTSPERVEVIGFYEGDANFEDVPSSKKYK